MIRPQNYRDILFTVAIVFVSIVFVFLATEILLRIVSDGERFFPYYPDSVRHVYPSEEITPGVNGISRFSTTRFGTRGPGLAGDEVVKILTIGGSTTADTLLDDEEAWPWLLGEYLNRALGETNHVWVTNSGIDGVHSHHHLMHAIYLLPQLPKLEYVIVYAGTNDMGMWFHHSSFDPNFLEKSENWNSRIGEAFRWSNFTPAEWPVYKRTEIWKRLARLKDRVLTARETNDNTRVIVQDENLKWLEEERARRQKASRVLLPKGKLETLPLALDSYESVLNRIVFEIREHGSTPVLMAQAVQSIFSNEHERSQLWMGELENNIGFVSEEQYPIILQEYNNRMKLVADKNGVHFIDLPKLIAKDSSLFYDGLHFNEVGARAAAEAVSEYFIENGLVGRN